MFILLNTTVAMLLILRAKSNEPSETIPPLAPPIIRTPPTLSLAWIASLFFNFRLRVFDAALPLYVKPTSDLDSQIWMTKIYLETVLIWYPGIDPPEKEIHL